MATWGPSKKREQTRALPPARDNRPARASSSSGGSSRSSASSGSAPPKVTRARYSKNEADTGGKRRLREDVTGEFKRAIAGREHEFYGLLLIAVGIILAAGVYFNVAGIFGDGVDWLVGAVAGLARYVVPVVLVAMGVALIRSARSSSPWRLVFGWTFFALSALGILHIARGPDSIFSVKGVTKAGGVIGWAVGEPVRTLLADFGSYVLFVAVGLVGVMFITQASLRTLAQHTGAAAQRTGRGMGAVAAPLGRAARQALKDLSSLSSDNNPDDEHRDELGGADSEADVGTAALALPPAPYDAADDLYGDEPAKARRARRGSSTAPPSGTAPSNGAGAGHWNLPPVSLLHRTGAQTIDRAEVEGRGRVLQESLQQHGVDTTLAGMTVGPTVTRYELELGPGVKVARVTSLQKDIAYAMAATDVRILAPIPGKSAIGVEVPNNTRQLVALGDLLVSPEATENSGTLDVAVGKDIAGKAVFLDLATTPHLLIAGATGAGKSSGINCILTSLLMRSTPDQVRLILVDPKQVEMGQYNRLPHLLTQPITNPKKAANALGWAVKEMERRYDILSEIGFRDITGYNAAHDRGELDPDPRQLELLGGPDADSPLGAAERLPFIVVVVDELNDLMMVAARDVEDSITRIAQKARAVGIHLIVATQRPSVNVITGVIKANIPARMAFAVTSLTDSRVILDQPGAEKLVGKGDMLLLPGNSSIPNRVQGSFVSEEEVRAVTAHWREQAPDITYVSGVEGADDGGGADMVTAASNAISAGGDDDDDAMMRQAMELVVRSQLGSTSMLQRKLKVGFARAGRIMDLLEQQGVVGPSEGSKARAVLMTVEEFEALNS
jgi:S-DNA-T family DNA segregation ATPase FtsK/SpoIIIE